MFWLVERDKDKQAGATPGAGSLLKFIIMNNNIVLLHQECKDAMARSNMYARMADKAKADMLAATEEVEIETHSLSHQSLAALAADYELIYNTAWQKLVAAHPYPPIDVMAIGTLLHS